MAKRTRVTAKSESFGIRLPAPLKEGFFKLDAQKRNSRLVQFISDLVAGTEPIEPFGTRNSDSFAVKDLKLLQFIKEQGIEEIIPSFDEISSKLLVEAEQLFLETNNLLDFTMKFENMLIQRLRIYRKKTVILLHLRNKGGTAYDLSDDDKHALSRLKKRNELNMIIFDEKKDAFAESRLQIKNNGAFSIFGHVPPRDFGTYTVLIADSFAWAYEHIFHSVVRCSALGDNDSAYSHYARGFQQGYFRPMADYTQLLFDGGLKQLMNKIPR